MKIGLPKHFPALILIPILALIIYHNIYQCPFVFDDRIGIEEHTTIRTLSNYSSPGGLLRPRAIVGFTFALNYKFGKLNVFGYHLVNVLIHIINGFIVYFLAQTIFTQLSNTSAQRFGEVNSLRSEVQSPKSEVQSRKSKIQSPKSKVQGPQPAISQSTINNQQSTIFLMSLTAALIFVAHPIQTQAVTYTVQRCASMAAMFYLAAVFFYLKARILAQSSKLEAQSSGGHPLSAFSLQSSAFFTLCIICGMLAFLSKQNTASLPGVMLLSEYLVIDRRWEGWKRKIPWFCLTFAFWGLFVLYVIGFFSAGISGGIEAGALLEDVSRLTQETENVSRWSYLCTQFNVLVIYIRLLFLPIGQNLDYMYPFKTGFFDGYTPLAFAFLIGIIGIGIWNIRKRPVISFGIFWFFITLSVESSLIPIRDALFEHRLYLPMFGFSIIVSYLVFHFLSNKRSLALVLSLSIIISLGLATYLRNITWQNDTTLWSDVVSKSFHNYRGHNNLGNALKKQGRTEKAVEHYLQALRIQPDFAGGHSNLGNALSKQGHTEEAIEHCLQALRIQPDFAEAHNNLAVALNKQGRTEEAIEHCLQALRIDPDFAEAHSNLGNALSKQGRTEEAIENYLQALRIQPNFAKVHNNLAAALDKQGRTEKAIEHYLQALRINPDYAEAHNNLGNALDKQGRTEEAIEHYLQALRIQPDFAEAHYNLAVALDKQGRTEEAIEHYLQALRIQPDFAKAHNNLAVALVRKGNMKGAIAHFRKALRINPDDSDAKNNLKKILMMQQR